MILILSTVHSEGPSLPQEKKVIISSVYISIYYK